MQNSITRRDFGKLALVGAGSLLLVDGLTRLPRVALADDVPAVKTASSYENVIRNNSHVFVNKNWLSDYKVTVNDTANFKLSAVYDSKNNGWQKERSVSYVGPAGGDNRTFSNPFSIRVNGGAYANDVGLCDIVIDCTFVRLRKDRSKSSNELYDTHGLAVFLIRSRESESASGRETAFAAYSADSVDSSGRSGYESSSAARRCGVQLNLTVRFVRSGTDKTIDTPFFIYFLDIDQPGRATSSNTRTYGDAYAESILVKDAERVYVSSGSWLTRQIDEEDGEIQFIGSRQSDSDSEAWKSGVLVQSDGGVAKFTWRGSNCGTAIGLAYPDDFGLVTGLRKTPDAARLVQA